MPGFGGEEPSYYAQVCRGRRRYEARARAKGIMPGSSGWQRYLEAHRHQFYRAGA